MLNTIVGALLPAVVTLLLGYVAGWHHDFTGEQAGVLNRMVMLYALPLTLFAGMVATPRGQFATVGPVAVVIAVGMIAAMLIGIVTARYLTHHDIGAAALIGLAVGGPAVPFVGPAVLGYLFGDRSAVLITVAGIAMNLVQVPLCLVLLSAQSGGRPRRRISSIGGHLLAAVKEPVVWAPLIGFGIALTGWVMPGAMRDSLSLLGKATGGVALFASGIVLFSQKVVIDRTVVAIVFARNIAVPAVAWGIVALLGASQATIREGVLTLAMPVASITVILAVRFRKAQREMASALFWSTISSIVTMGAFIVLTN